MEHLFNSRFKIWRLTATASNGELTATWAAVTLGAATVYFNGRLDLQFIRPGKDAPMAIEAGRAPDRMGVLFCSSAAGIKAGDRIESVNNAVGEKPVSGVFEVRQIPDVAQGFTSAHHIEVQVQEVAQAVSGIFPGST